MHHTCCFSHSVVKKLCGLCRSIACTCMVAALIVPFWNGRVTRVDTVCDCLCKNAESDDSGSGCRLGMPSATVDVTNQSIHVSQTINQTIKRTINSELIH